MTDKKKKKTRFGVRWNQWSLISKRARWFLTWPFVGAVSSVTLLGKFLDWWPPTIIFRRFFARSRRPKKSPGGFSFLVEIIRPGYPLTIRPFTRESDTIYNYRKVCERKLVWNFGMSVERNRWLRTKWRLQLTYRQLRSADVREFSHPPTIAWNKVQHLLK